MLAALRKVADAMGKARLAVMDRLASADEAASAAVIVAVAVLAVVEVAVCGGPSAQAKAAAA